MISKLSTIPEWDVLVIGGGATGLGAAVDAASRGYKTLLVESHDFAKGTSSRSTKLVHGGVRYLAQGNIRLVMDALKERGMLLKNAPHVASDLSFVIPAYHWWQKIYYGIGLKMYDLMAGRLSLGNTRILSAKKTIEYLPSVNQQLLKGGIVYHDGQFDDTRLAINLAQTAAEHGAILINYCKVTAFIKENNRITGVVLEDQLNKISYNIRSRSVINATGVFTDAILKMDDPLQPDMVTVSQGIHLVLDKKFFPGKHALMVPKTADGRVLFAVPWHGKVIAGTTDTPVGAAVYEPLPLEEEINFILTHLNLYLSENITRKDVLSVFTGLRPLVKIKDAERTSLLPRDHSIVISKIGLVTITGGKWTTYRKMAKEVVDKTAALAGLQKEDCITADLRIHGYTTMPDREDTMHYYGSDAGPLKELFNENRNWQELIHPLLPYPQACVVWAVRHEMAMTAEYVLARRTRALFTNAAAAIEAAPLVAQLMAKELQKDEDWINQNINDFIKIANGYLLKQ